jgi:hypothetical protein
MPKIIPMMTAGMATTIGEITAYQNRPETKPLPGIRKEGPFSDVTPIITFFLKRCP